MVDLNNLPKNDYITMNKNLVELVKKNLNGPDLTNPITKTELDDLFTWFDDNDVGSNINKYINYYKDNSVWLNTLNDGIKDSNKLVNMIRYEKNDYKYISIVFESYSATFNDVTDFTKETIVSTKTYQYLILIQDVKTKEAYIKLSNANIDFLTLDNFKIGFTDDKAKDSNIDIKDLTEEKNLINFNLLIKSLINRNSIPPVLSSEVITTSLYDRTKLNFDKTSITIHMSDGIDKTKNKYAYLDPLVRGNDYIYTDGNGNKKPIKPMVWYNSISDIKLPKFVSNVTTATDDLDYTFESIYDYYDDLKDNLGNMLFTNPNGKNNFETSFTLEFQDEYTDYIFITFEANILDENHNEVSGKLVPQIFCLFQDKSSGVIQYKMSNFVEDVLLINSEYKFDYELKKYVDLDVSERGARLWDISKFFEFKLNRGFLPYSLQDDDFDKSTEDIGYTVNGVFDILISTDDHDKLMYNSEYFSLYKPDYYPFILEASIITKPISIGYDVDNNYYPNSFHDEQIRGRNIHEHDILKDEAYLIPQMYINKFSISEFADLKTNGKISDKLYFHYNGIDSLTFPKHQISIISSDAYVDRALSDIKYHIDDLDYFEKNKQYPRLLARFTNGDYRYSIIDLGVYKDLEYDVSEESFANIKRSDTIKQNISLIFTYNTVNGYLNIKISNHDFDLPEDTLKKIFNKLDIKIAVNDKLVLFGDIFIDDINGFTYNSGNSASLPINYDFIKNKIKLNLGNSNRYYFMKFLSNIEKQPSSWDCLKTHSTSIFKENLYSPSSTNLYLDKATLGSDYILYNNDQPTGMEPHTSSMIVIDKDLKPYKVLYVNNDPKTVMETDWRNHAFNLGSAYFVLIPMYTNSNGDYYFHFGGNDYIGIDHGAEVYGGVRYLTSPFNDMNVNSHVYRESTEKADDHKAINPVEGDDVLSDIFTKGKDYKIDELLYKDNYIVPTYINTLNFNTPSTGYTQSVMSDNLFKWWDDNDIENNLTNYISVMSNGYCSLFDNKDELKNIIKFSKNEFDYISISYITNTLAFDNKYDKSKEEYFTQGSPLKRNEVDEEKYTINTTILAYDNINKLCKIKHSTNSKYLFKCDKFGKPIMDQIDFNILKEDNQYVRNNNVLDKAAVEYYYDDDKTIPNNSQYKSFGKYLKNINIMVKTYMDKFNLSIDVLDYRDKTKATSWTCKKTGTSATGDNKFNGTSVYIDKTTLGNSYRIGISDVYYLLLDELSRPYVFLFTDSDSKGLLTDEDKKKAFNNNNFFYIPLYTDTDGEYYYMFKGKKYKGIEHGAEVFSYVDYLTNIHSTNTNDAIKNATVVNDKNVIRDSNEVATDHKPIQPVTGDTDIEYDINLLNEPLQVIVGWNPVKTKLSKANSQGNVKINGDKYTIIGRGVVLDRDRKPYRILQVESTELDDFSDDDKKKFLVYNTTSHEVLVPLYTDKNENHFYQINGTKYSGDDNGAEISEAVYYMKYALDTSDELNKVLVNLDTNTNVVKDSTMDDSLHRVLTPLEMDDDTDYLELPNEISAKYDSTISTILHHDPVKTAVHHPDKVIHHEDIKHTVTHPDRVVHHQSIRHTITHPDKRVTHHHADTRQSHTHAGYYTEDKSTWSVDSDADWGSEQTDSTEYSSSTAARNAMDATVRTFNKNGVAERAGRIITVSHTRSGSEYTDSTKYSTESAARNAMDATVRTFNKNGVAERAGRIISTTDADGTYYQFTYYTISETYHKYKFTYYTTSDVSYGQTYHSGSTYYTTVHHPDTYTYVKVPDTYTYTAVPDTTEAVPDTYTYTHVADTYEKVPDTYVYKVVGDTTQVTKDQIYDDLIKYTSDFNNRKNNDIQLVSMDNMFITSYINDGINTQENDYAPGTYGSINQKLDDYLVHLRSFNNWYNGSNKNNITGKPLIINNPVYSITFPRFNSHVDVDLFDYFSDISHNMRTYFPLAMRAWKSSINYDISSSSFLSSAKHVSSVTPNTPKGAMISESANITEYSKLYDLLPIKDVMYKFKEDDNFKYIVFNIPVRNVIANNSVYTNSDIYNLADDLSYINGILIQSKENGDIRQFYKIPDLDGDVTEEILNLDFDTYFNGFDLMIDGNPHSIHDSGIIQLDISEQLNLEGNQYVMNDYLAYKILMNKVKNLFPRLGDMGYGHNLTMAIRSKGDVLDFIPKTKLNTSTSGDIFTKKINNNKPILLLPDDKYTLEPTAKTDYTTDKLTTTTIDKDTFTKLFSKEALNYNMRNIYGSYRGFLPAIGRYKNMTLSNDLYKYFNSLYNTDDPIDAGYLNYVNYLHIKENVSIDPVISKFSKGDYKYVLITLPKLETRFSVTPTSKIFDVDTIGTDNKRSFTTVSLVLYQNVNTNEFKYQEIFSDNYTLKNKLRIDFPTDTPVEEDLIKLCKRTNYYLMKSIDMSDTEYGEITNYEYFLESDKQQWIANSIESNNVYEYPLPMSRYVISGEPFKFYKDYRISRKPLSWYDTSLDNNSFIGCYNYTKTFGSAIKLPYPYTWLAIDLPYVREKNDGDLFEYLSTINISNFVNYNTLNAIDKLKAETEFKLYQTNIITSKYKYAIFTNNFCNVMFFQDTDNKKIFIKNSPLREPKMNYGIGSTMDIIPDTQVYGQFTSKNKGRKSILNRHLNYISNIDGDEIKFNFNNIWSNKAYDVKVNSWVDTNTLKQIQYIYESNIVNDINKPNNTSSKVFDLDTINQSLIDNNLIVKSRSLVERYTLPSHVSEVNNSAPSVINLISYMIDNGGFDNYIIKKVK